MGFLGFACIGDAIQQEKDLNTQRLKQARVEAKKDYEKKNQENQKKNPDEYVQTFLNQLESHNLDFKEIFPKQAHDIGKLISAFANNVGGRIFFGIRDQPRDIVGASNPQELEERVEGERKSCNPIPEMAFEVFTLSDGKKVLEAKVGQSNTLVQYDGRFYFRDLNSSSTRFMTTDEIIERTKRSQ